MAQSLDAQVGVTALRRESRRERVAALPGDELETGSHARGVDVFRLVVALTGLAAFFALPTAVIVGVALLLR